ncbi:transcription factor bHLH167 [Coffea arabica]|uniref:Transcription factor bHLH167 n=2 Tax=Coffea TaxID=13442 RepID=A0A6P6V6J2_COFAR|nr:transcription factor bHLH168-like [Coffea arabica]
MQAGNLKPRTPRGVMERHRRQQMKNLYSKLASLLLPPASEVNLPLPALLDYSLTHVKNLKERIQELEAKKEKLKGEIGSSTADIVLQAVKIIEKGPILEVNLETGLHKRFILPEVISILEEGGAQVLSASYATLTDRVLYTISSEASSPRIGIETSRLHDRLKALGGTGCFFSSL